MSRKLCCDGCGDESLDTPDVRSIWGRISFFKLETALGGQPYQSEELCPQCMSTMRLTLQRFAKKESSR